MRRATARGRMLPQSLSTDPRMGRLSLKAALLFPLMWVNCDDQGRLSGDPEEIKYAVCPNIDHIAKMDIPELLKELEGQVIIKAYSTSKAAAIQMLDWWDVQKLQWAWPSLYSPPVGWQDRLRYKKSAKEIIILNWGSPEGSPERSPEGSPESSPEGSPEGSGEILGEEKRSEQGLVAIGLAEKRERTKEKNIRGKRRGRRRGISPERSPERSPENSGEKHPPPTITVAKILKEISSCYEQEIGVISPFISDQLQEFANCYHARDAPIQWIKEAFGEAAKNNKRNWAYVKAILKNWIEQGKGTGKSRSRRLPTDEEIRKSIEEA